MNRLLYFLFFLQCITVGFAQKCDITLKGKIIDFHDNSDMEGASVQVLNSNKFTTSNLNGEFVVKNLCAGKLVILIKHIACEDKRIEIQLTQNTFTEIYLEHHLEELDEVSISAKLKTETKTAQETVIKTATLEKYSSLSLGDALKEVPGVSSINTGNTIVKPVINGMHSSRVLIMNNGVRLQDQEWGVEHAPNIDINSAGQISVIKGAGALAYGGDAVGGVIVVKPSRFIRKDTLFGRTILGGQTNGSGYNATTTLNKHYNSGWFAQVQGTYRKSGDFTAPNYNLSNTGFNTSGVSTRFGKKNFESGFEAYYSYLFNEIGILRAAHLGSAFDLQNALISREPQVIRNFTYAIDVPKQDITHHLFKINFYKRFKNFGKLSLQYDYQNNQRFEFDVRIGDLKKIPAIDLKLQTHTILADIDLDANSNRKINFGILGRFQDNFADPSTGVRRLIPDYLKYDFGIYTIAEWKFTDAVLIDAGIRYDYNHIDAKKFYRKSRWEERGYSPDFDGIITRDTGSQFLTNPVFNFHNFSASAGLRYNLNKSDYFIFNYALASRPPNPSELFSDGVHQALARFELGNLRFTQEISHRVSTSYNYSSSKFNLLTELFYNNIKDYMYLRPFDNVRTNRGPYPVWAYRQANAYWFGIDLATTYNFINNWNLKTKMAFIKGYEVEENLPLIDMPPFNTTNQITYTNKNWYNFSASLTSEWVFRQNEFPNFNFEITDLLNDETTLVDISTPPDAYHLMHFSSQLTFKLTNKTKLNVAIGINNIFNQSYRNYLNQLRFYADDLGRNFTLRIQLNY